MDNSVGARSKTCEKSGLLTGFQRDHGGGIDAARAAFGGARIGWADLSTGINPLPYTVPAFGQDVWTALPDTSAMEELCSAARRFWNVPQEAAIVATPGASSIIAQIPTLCARGCVHIPAPTYNEHAAAFEMHGWKAGTAKEANAQVVVHPNNPTGALWTAQTLPAAAPALTVIDESFCDVCPEQSLITLSDRKGTLVLKSFGKFWGLAGIRLGFAIGDPALIEQLRARLGPWAVSGPALRVGAVALDDLSWADQTRQRLARDSDRLDRLMVNAGASVEGGTPLFRLYRVDAALDWQTRLARHHIWSRVFPYNPQRLRLGLPHPLHWSRLEAALA